MFTFAKKTYPRASLTNKALMIVDMQDDFLNNHKTNKYTSQFFKLKQKVIKSVKEKIEEANDSNSEIILVEYDGNGETIEEIKKVIKKRALIIHKDSSGILSLNNSYRSITFNNLKDRELDEIGIVGVNTSSCVLATLVTMTKKGFNAKVHLDATMNNFEGKTLNDFLEDNKIKNIIDDYSFKNLNLRELITGKFDLNMFKLDEIFNRNINTSFRNKGLIVKSVWLK